jgi:hypothetical protein
MVPIGKKLPDMRIVQSPQQIREIIDTRAISGVSLQCCKVLDMWGCRGARSTWSFWC